MNNTFWHSDSTDEFVQQLHFTAISAVPTHKKPAGLTYLTIYNATGADKHFNKMTFHSSY